MKIQLKKFENLKRTPNYEYDIDTFQDNECTYFGEQTFTYGKVTI